MNASPFWPLVWKEYRAGRAFWLAMAVMGLVAQAGVAWLAHRSADRDLWLYQIALMISAGFAVGIGGTLFAVEHEERTFALLRVLPVRARELGWAKLLCALAGLLSLMLALWLAASALAGWQGLPRHDAGGLWGLWGLASAEGLAWGILCSLAIRSPLRATVTALLAVTFSIQAAVTLTATHSLSNIASYIEAIPYRVGLLALVAALDVWLLPRWLAGTFPERGESGRASERVRRTKATSTWRSPAPDWMAPLLRLMWQTCGETAGSPTRLVVFVLAGVAGCSLFVTALAMGALDFRWGLMQPIVVNEQGLIPPLFLVPFVLLTALIGSLAFSLDPMWHARFLAEHGVSPRLVWVSRQIVWGGCFFVMLGIVVFLVLVDWIAEPPGFRRWGFYHHIPKQKDLAINAWLLWTVFFSTYAVSQAVSMAIGRRLLAAVISAVLGSLAAGWAYLMFALDVPWFWSVLPLGLACLAATWLRAPAWLWGRKDWQSWIAPGAVLAAAIAWIAAAVPSYRADEIQTFKVDWPAVPSPAASAGARSAIEMYQKASDLIGWSDKKVAQEIDDLALQASAQPSVWVADDPKISWRAKDAIWGVGMNWLLPKSGHCQQEGELDRAFDLYLAALRVADQVEQTLPNRQFNPQLAIRSSTLAGIRSWAAEPGQTSERIRAAIERLADNHSATRSAVAWLRSWYAASRLTIVDLPAAMNLDLPAHGVSAEEWISSELPWERERALRLLDVVAAIELDRLAGLESKFQANMPIEMYLRPLLFEEWDGRITEIGFNRGFWYRGGDIPRGPIVQWLRTTPLVDRESMLSRPLTWLIASDETDFRATLIVLALEAWRIDHGALPERLDELVPAEIASLPLDPVYAKPFLYYPHGVTGRVDGRIPLNPPAEESADRTSPPMSFFAPASHYGPIGSQPFLWSALGPIPGNQRVELGDAREEAADEGKAFYAVGHHPGDRNFTFETGVLPAGRAYLIPAPAEEKPAEEK